jgi:hypothetical protein
VCGRIFSPAADFFCCSGREVWVKLATLVAAGGGI